MTMRKAWAVLHLQVSMNLQRTRISKGKGLIFIPGPLAFRRWLALQKAGSTDREGAASSSRVFFTLWPRGRRKVGSFSFSV